MDICLLNVLPLKPCKAILLTMILMTAMNLQGVSQFTAGGTDTINPGVPVTLTATYGLTGTGIPSLPNSEDWVQGPFPIGFDFIFFGKRFSSFYVGANGWISFSPNPNSYGIREAFAVPNAADYTPKNCILGPFQDLNPTTEGGPFIFYRTIGEAPNRRLVVMWCDCPMYVCTSSTVTFQIILDETTNIVENHIFSKPACPENYANKATLGVQDGTGYIGFSPPGYNATSWSSDTMAWRYTPTSADSMRVRRIPYHMEPITPGDKISYRWYDGSTLISEEQTIVVTPASTTTYTAFCTLCSGIEFKTVVTVFVNPAIPNAFTPNGDGLNDKFQILGLPPENITEFNLQIFNRWGQLVFETTNITMGWDGRLNGEYCPEGYYSWVIFYRDDKKNRVTNKGLVMLLR